VFAISLTAFASLTAVLWNHGFAHEPSVARWAMAIRNADSPDGATHALTHGFPWLPSALLWPFTMTSFTRTILAPALISSTVAAALVTAFFRRLRAQKVSLAVSIASTVLLACGPMVLWPAISGDATAFSLLMYFWFCAAVLRASEVEDARALMTIAGLLASSWFCDARFILMLLPVLPLTSVVIPRKVLEQHIGAGYLVLLFPSAVALGSCVYVGLMLAGDPLWLLPTGVRDVPASRMLAGAVGAVLLSLSALLARGRSRVFLLLLLLPLICGCLDQVVSAQPGYLLFGVLLTAPAAIWAAEILTKRPALGLGAMVATTACLWLTLALATSPEVPRALASEVRLGEWMRNLTARNVLVDDASLSSVLAYRNRADDLILPGDPRFELAVSGRDPGVDVLLLPDPRQRDRPAPDRLNDAYPTLYTDGLPGYRLEYDQDGWRAWRRIVKEETQQSSAAYKR